MLALMDQRPYTPTRRRAGRGRTAAKPFFAYSMNYLIDIENAIIVDVEATTAIRQAEVLAAKRMVERSLERFDLYPSRLLGDSGYGSAEMLGWLVYEHGIRPHVTVFDKSARTDGTFSREDFTYDQASDVYTCPGGKMLTATGTLKNDGATMLYRASKHDCTGYSIDRNDHATVDYIIVTEPAAAVADGLCRAPEQETGC
jgi:hypothetical protein